jgi:hypothetical protein
MNHTLFKTIFLSIVVVCHTISAPASIPNAITYRLTHGRLGDQMLAYATAKWLSYKYQIPLLYQPFQHSEKFKLHLNEKLPAEQNQHQYAQDVSIEPSTVLHKISSDSTLYISHLNVKNDVLQDLDSTGRCVAQDPQFKKIVTDMFTPTVPIKKLKLPKRRITVALHVRKGSGRDQPLLSRQLYDTKSYLSKTIRTIDKTDVKKLHADERYPNKFPPDQFYIDQLRLLSDLLDNQLMYVYLFTDYKDPQRLVNIYKLALRRPNITFAYHSPELLQEMDVIDDYWNMAQFDCLIRGGSNLSRAAQLFGNHTVVIYVKDCHWHADAVVADEVEIIVYNKKDRKYSIFNKQTSKKQCPKHMKKTIKNAFQKG